MGDAQSQIVAYEHEIEAGVADVWNAFTTNKGLMSWMAPIAEIELRIGGKMTSNYNKDGELGDATTIENTILSYEPERMLSLQATRFPAGFPFEEAAKGTWSVFYFTPISPTRTRVRVVGLGYRDDEQSRKMKSFFAGANKQSLDGLNKALVEKLKSAASK
ncbi:SRPBCC family protein [Planctomycetaceae bacterium SH139]